MNNAKYEKIRDFLLVWGYKPEDITQYLKQVAPEKLVDNGKAARHQQMNDMLNAVLGRQQDARPPMPIQKPETSSGIAHDLWLLLGLADDPITVDDLAEYTSERIKRIEERQRGIAEGAEMAMSNHIRALNREEDERNARELDALWAQSDRLRSDPRTMNEVLAGLSARDAQTLTIIDSSAYSGNK